MSGQGRHAGLDDLYGSNGSAVTLISIRPRIFPFLNTGFGIDAWMSIKDLVAAICESVSESTTFQVKRAEDHFHAVGTDGVGDSLMPMPSQFEAQFERLTPSASDTKLQTALLTEVLLLEPDLAILTERTTLLTDSNYSVTTARNQSDLFIVRGKTGISLAILSDCLGAAALGVAAHSISRGWPLARILILGEPQFVLDDNLYDEAIDHRFVRAELLLTIAKICHPSVNRGRDGGLFILHRGTTETDARTPSRGDEVQ